METGQINITAIVEDYLDAKEQLSEYNAQKKQQEKDSESPVVMLKEKLKSSTAVLKTYLQQHPDLEIGIGENKVLTWEKKTSYSALKFADVETVVYDFFNDNNLNEELAVDLLRSIVGTQTPTVSGSLKIKKISKKAQDKYRSN